VVVLGWFPFIRPWQVDNPTLVISVMFMRGNQTYFIGLCFSFLSGFVTTPALKFKGFMGVSKGQILPIDDSCHFV
jgi:hypothetical protein